MKIIYLFDGTILSRESGSAVHVRSMVSAFKERGHQITVFDTFSGRIIPNNEVLNEDYNYKAKHFVIFIFLFWMTQKEARFYPNASTYLLQIERIVNYWFSAIVLKRLLARDKVDFIYEREEIYGNVGTIMKKELGIPFVLEINTPLISAIKWYHLRAFTNIVDKREKKMLQFADYIVVASEGLRTYLIQDRGIKAQKIEVTLNGVDFKLFNEIEREETELLRCKYHLQDSLVIGFVGCLWEPILDFDTLFKAFAMLKSINKERSIKFLIIGTAKGREKIQNMIDRLSLSKEVIFTDYVKHCNIPEYLALIDISVVSYYRNLANISVASMKVIEYMAAKKAIVASNVPDLDKILHNGVSAILVEPGDVIGLRDAMDILVKDKNLREQLGNKAHIKSREFTWVNNVKKIEKIFNL
ncbi:MAG: glycosyltransferase family 4 protein [Candidatus Stahlbacteria bacterium]|nr:glycosyltransferase family 4 protein [Candidatus Stahlbacteria bacterium]